MAWGLAYEDDGMGYYIPTHPTLEFSAPRYQPRDAHNAYRAQTREARHPLAIVFVHCRPWKLFVFCTRAPSRKTCGLTWFCPSQNLGLEQPKIGFSQQKNWG